MGLYINRDNHMDIYKNNRKIDEPNQGFFIRNHVEEMIKEQKRINESLHRSFHRLKWLQQQSEYKQSGQWQEIDGKLKELKAINQQHVKLEEQVVTQLKKLENENKRVQQLLEDGRLSKQELSEKLTAIGQSNQLIVTKLEAYGEENEKLAIKINQQGEVQQELSEQISKQEENQEEVVSKLETQVALTEKIARQIDYFRSILFERTSFLAEKIENGYQLTSAYIAKVVNGKEQTMEGNPAKEKEKQKSSK
ncbi:hypothetical protein CIL03_06520 [Virgibacillus indicus]|uniref:Uncharacterized protein n=1 Tax=Virgibacillus indicus TaxID=2024554 RepID=A0A265NC51_9BACI|nr:hypothetical protein [Virgibacillus indicus]OZU89365.1 hypothetical protein CIL03_06520 [Virgibacillus indicus]